ncbi:hypothetical protein [Dactylosporangium sp. NPDC048998]|uniref:hypothetical protein n=1 Tax=Dactylosporangium sp. NPDC048998 TaxID=3363976 RepID=UPI00371B2386
MLVLSVRCWMPYGAVSSLAVGRPAWIGRGGSMTDAWREVSVPAPRDRRVIGCTVEFTIGGVPGAMTTGHAPDGELRQVDLRADVHGSALAGWADALATAITLGLQHGAPPTAYVDVLRRLEVDATAVDAADPARHALVDALTVGAVQHIDTGLAAGQGPSA